MYCDTFQNERQYFLWRSQYVRSSYCSRCSEENSDIPYISYWGKPSYENGSWRKRYKEGRTVDIDLSPLIEVLHRIDRIDTSMGRPNYHRLHKGDDATRKQVDHEKACESHLSRIADDSRSNDYRKERSKRYIKYLEEDREFQDDLSHQDYQKDKNNHYPTEPNKELLRENNSDIFQEEQSDHSPENICDKYQDHREVTDSEQKNELCVTVTKTFNKHCSSQEETPCNASNECMGQGNVSAVNQQTDATCKKANKINNEQYDLSQNTRDSLGSISSYLYSDSDHDSDIVNTRASDIQNGQTVFLKSVNARNNDIENDNRLERIDTSNTKYDGRDTHKDTCTRDSTIRNEHTGRNVEVEKGMSVKDIISNIEANTTSTASCRPKIGPAKVRSDSKRNSKSKTNNNNEVEKVDNVLDKQRNFSKHRQNLTNNLSEVKRKEKVENELSSVKLRKTLTSFQKADSPCSVESNKSSISLLQKPASSTDNFVCQSNQNYLSRNTRSNDSIETQTKLSKQDKNTDIPLIIVHSENEENASDKIKRYNTPDNIKNSPLSGELQDRHSNKEHQESRKLSPCDEQDGPEINNLAITRETLLHKSGDLKTESGRNHGDETLIQTPELTTNNSIIQENTCLLRRKSLRNQSRTPEDSENKSGNISKSRDSSVARYQQRRRLSRSQRDRRSSLHRVRMGLEDEDDEFMKIQQKLNTLGKYSTWKAPSNTDERPNTLSLPKTIWNRNIRNAIYGQQQYSSCDTSNATSDLSTHDEHSACSEDDANCMERSITPVDETCRFTSEKRLSISKKSSDDNKLAENTQRKHDTELVKKYGYSDEASTIPSHRTNLKNRRTQQFLEVPDPFTTCNDGHSLSESSDSEKRHNRKSKRDKLESSPESLESEKHCRRTFKSNNPENTHTEHDKVTLELDTDDEESSKLQWRARGYSNDFYYSRQSRTGTEIIERYRQRSNRSSNRSSKATSPISSTEGSRKSSLSGKLWTRKPCKRLGSLEENLPLSITTGKRISPCASRSERRLSESCTQANPEQSTDNGINADLLKVALERAARCTARLDRRLDSQLK